MSSAPGAPGPVEHSIRRVGAVTAALCAAPVGSLVGIRGPFGTSWGIDEVEDGADVVVMAGGIGLAPLRGAVRDLVARQQAGRGRVFVLAGARSPDQILFRRGPRSLGAGRGPRGISVDVGAPGWTGLVGVVTALLPGRPFEASGSRALLCGPEIMMRFGGRALVDRGVDPGRVRVSLERNMQCGIGLCGHCQLGPLLVCRDGPDRALRRAGRCAVHGAEPVTPDAVPTLAVWKFASCDGCQLSLLDCEDELLALAGAVRIAHFTEMTRAHVDGPYDVSLVEGSITTAEDAERIRAVRAASRRLITIGACATSGGVQALRNLAEEGEFVGVGLRPPRVRVVARDVDADLGPCAGRLRAQRLPDRSSPAARGHHGLAGRAAPGHPRPHGVPAVQGPGHGVCPRGPRDAVPRAGDPGRLRRAVPVGRPRAATGASGRSAERTRRHWPSICSAQGMAPVDASRLFSTFYSGNEVFGRQAVTLRARRQSHLRPRACRDASR